MRRVGDEQEKARIRHRLIDLTAEEYMRKRETDEEGKYSGCSSSSSRSSLDSARFRARPVVSLIASLPHFYSPSPLRPRYQQYRKERINRLGNRASERTSEQPAGRQAHGRTGRPSNPLAIHRSQVRISRLPHTYSRVIPEGLRRYLVVLYSPFSRLSLREYVSEPTHPRPLPPSFIQLELN